MKKRMAILMSMAIAANMIASVPVCAADIFTDSMTTDSVITQEADDDSFSDGSGTPDFAVSRRMYRRLRMRVHKARKNRRR